jgi:hypothetical protein
MGRAKTYQKIHVRLFRFTESLHSLLPNMILEQTVQMRRGRLRNDLRYGRHVEALGPQVVCDNKTWSPESSCTSTRSEVIVDTVYHIVTYRPSESSCTSTRSEVIVGTVYHIVTYRPLLGNDRETNSETTAVARQFSRCELLLL